MRKTKPKPRHAQPRAKQSRPNVVFRTDRAALVRLDTEAARRQVTRSDLINAALESYLFAPADTAGVEDAGQIDLFA